MKFSERLRELRAEKNITQTQLAQAIGVSHACIAMLEMEKRAPTGSTLVLLANYFGCSIDFLLGRADDFGVITIQGKDIQLPSDAKELVDMFLTLTPMHRTQVLEYTRYFTERENATKKKNF